MVNKFFTLLKQLLNKFTKIEFKVVINRNYEKSKKKEQNTLERMGLISELELSK